MKPQSAKNKGRLFQQFVVRKILEAFPELTSHDVSSRSMGASGTDVLLSAKALEIFPFSIEAKHRKSLNIKEMIKQAEANTIENTYPLAIFKGHRATEEDVFIAMRLSTFLDLVKGRTHGSKQKKE